MKGKFACRRCGKFGHVKNAHNVNRRLKPGVNLLENIKIMYPHLKGERKGKEVQNNEPKTKFSSRYYVLHGVIDTHSKCSKEKCGRFETFGTLVDGGTSCRAIGEMELHIVSKMLICPPPTTSNFKEFAEYNSWKYGSVACASSKKAKTDCFERFVLTDSEHIIGICHLISQRWSIWVIEWYPIRMSNMQHISGNALLLPNDETVSDADIKHHSYISIQRIVRDCDKYLCVTCLGTEPFTVESETLEN